MKIITSSTNQNDSKYGPRAGKQCMSNSFSFLHTVYLNGINNSLNAGTIDAIMEEGYHLDTASTLALMLDNSDSQDYRLLTEIPRRIHSRYGVTQHELSRPFNGTLDTQKIDNEVYFGLIDFILYGKTKNCPAFAVITIGVLSRAFFFLNNTLYLFDSHPTEREATAAIYICQDIEEAYELLTAHGTEGFYYDASFIFFIETSNLSLSSHDAELLILKTYKDPDIAITLDKFSSTEIHDIKKTDDIESQQDLVAAKTTDLERAPQKRKKNSHSLELELNDKKKKDTASLTYYATEVDLIPSFYELRSQFQSLFHDLKSFPIMKSQFNWTIYLQDSPMNPNQPFATPFLWNRVFHLLCQIVDVFVGVGSTNDDSSKQKQQTIFINYLLPFKDFSEVFNEALTACQENNLDILLIYNNYLCKTTTFRTLERILLSKFLAIADNEHEKHYEWVKSWTTQMLQEMPKKLDDIENYLKAYVSQNPVKHFHEFVCLNKAEKHNIAVLLNEKRKEIQEDIERDKNIFAQISNFIDKLGETPALPIESENVHKVHTSDITEAIVPRFMTESIELPNISTLNNTQQLSLEKQISEKLTNTIHTLRNKFTKIVQDNYNNLAAGFMPVTELNCLFAYLVNLYFNIEVLKHSGLNINTELLQEVEKLYDNTQFLRFGTSHFNINNLSNFTLSIRKMFVDFYNSQKPSDRASEILAAIESILADPSKNKTIVNIEMIKSQLEELGKMEISTTENKQTAEITKQILGDQELTPIYDFLHHLSAYNLPNTTTVKNLHLHFILEKRPDIAAILHDKIQSILDICIDDMLNDITVPEQTFSTVLFLVDLFPNSTEKTALFESVLTLRQLAKKCANLKTLEEFDDLAQFITTNSEQLQNMMKQHFGKKIPTLMDHIKFLYSQKIITAEEKNWIQRAKTAVITSPEELTAFLATAPTKHALQTCKPELDKALQRHMEEQMKQTAENDKKHILTIRNTLEKRLNDILLILKDGQFSSLETVHLNLLETFLKQLQDNDLIIHFTHALLPVLKDIETTISKTISDILEKILIKTPLNPEQMSKEEQKYTPLLSFLSKFKKTTFCTEDVKTEIDQMQKSITFLTKIATSTNKYTRISHSVYGQELNLYEERITELKKETNKIKEQLSKEYAVAEKKILLSSQDAKTNKIYLVLNTHTLKEIKNTQFRETAFAKALTVEVNNKENQLQELLNHFNAHLKAKMDQNHITKLSFDTKWTAFVSDSRLYFPDFVDIKLQDFISDPFKVISQLMNKAANEMPYIQAEITLKWLTQLVHDINKFCLSAISEFGKEAIPFNYAALRDLEYQINTKYVEIENKVICNETVENTKNIPKLTKLLKELDPKRVAGGQKQYQTLMNKILTSETSMQQTYEKEQLKKEYFETVNNVASFKLAFNFPKQRQNVERLMEKFKSLPKSQPFEKFPEENDLFSDSLITENYINGLRALLNFITAAQNYIQNTLLKQWAVFQQQNFIPIDYSVANVKPISDLYARLRIERDRQVFYQVNSVFGTQLIVDETGVPLQFHNIFYNAVVKFFSLNYKQIHVPEDTPRLVSSQYKLLSVCKSFIIILQQFWENIITLDLGPYLRDGTQNFKRELIPIVNLKLFIYIITQAWTASEDSTVSTAFELPIKQFTLLILCSHPEYLYGCLSHPTDLVINSLAKSIDKDSLYDTFVVSHNPPEKPMHLMRSICIDTQLWQSAKLMKDTFQQTFFTQLCPQNEKFFIYLTAFLILPYKFLNYIWIQYKPITFTQRSYQNLIKDLCSEYVHQNKITMCSVTPHEPDTIKSGEKITSKITVHKAQNTPTLTRLQAQEYVFDYILYSFLTGYEMTFAMYIDTIEKTYLLCMRHLENVLHDKDFQSVLRARTFDINYILKQSWTKNIVEHSIFSVQLNKIVSYLNHTNRATPNIPLILFNYDNEVVNVYLPPMSTNPKKVAFYIKNPFHFPVQEYEATDLISFHLYPKTTDILNQLPPNKTVSTRPYNLSSETLTTKNLSEPKFKQPTVTGLMPKSQSIILSTDTNVLETSPDIKANTASAAIKDVTLAREQISEFSESINTTLSKLKSLYL